MNSTFKSIALWMVVIIITFLLWHLFQASKKQEEQIIFSDFLAQVEKGEIVKVTIVGNKISGEYIGSEATFVTFAPDYDNLIDILRKHNVQIEAKEANQKQWVTALISWAPMILLIGIWIFFMRQMQAGGTKALTFGKSRAKLSTGQKKKVTFKDVAGVDDAEEELEEVIEFLKDPRKFQKLGGRIPKGVLLMGLPGSGKTLLARAISGEANVPFFSISGSDFVEMFVGVGASRVRDLFEQGKKNAPCIIFIDEIDAVGRYRGAGLGGGHDEREQTLNQLLVEMDGFDTNEGVIIIAATNRPDVLDPALLRPGRFDRRIVINLPDIKGREEILKVHARKIQMAKDVALEIIARGTPGFSGADLESLVNEAALIAARLNKKLVDLEDLEYAKDKVLMGTERKSMIISDEEKRNAAYHEAGHALVAVLMPNADPIHKVTIIPRGMALGVTQQLPVDDRHNYTSNFLLDQITVLLGGRASEEILLEDITTGAGNDLERATELARKMVREWGMSENVGPLTFAKKDEYVFLGKEFGQSNDYSEETATLIDKEIKRIVDTCYAKAKNVLSNNKDKLLAIANNLLEREVLDAEEIKLIIEGKSLKPKLSKKVAKASPKGKSEKRAKEKTEKKKVDLKTPQLEGPSVR